MEVIKTLRPGSPGTKKFVEHYGDNLVAVRYRQDRRRKRQLTTIEIIVDEREPSNLEIDRKKKLSDRRRQFCALRIAYEETDLRAAVKQAGGRWESRQKVWWLPREDVVAMRLLGRVEEGLEEPDMDISWYKSKNR